MTTISDDWVRARKQHCCDLCGEPILVGEIHRRWVGRDGRYLYRSRFHATCMRVTQIDKWDEIDWECPMDHDDFKLRRRELEDQGKLGGAS